MSSRHGLLTVYICVLLVIGAHSIRHGQGRIVSTTKPEVARHIALPHSSVGVPGGGRQPAFHQLIDKPNETKQSSQHTVPEVRHYKQAGAGYSKQSPLYRKQEVMRGIGIDVAASGDDPNEANTWEAKADVSTSMECIIHLTAQWFILYAAYFIVITMNTQFGMQKPFQQNILKAACQPLFFVPMLCVLFIAVRLRAVQLAQGQTEKYGLPPWWVQRGMYVCTWAILAEIFLALLYCVVTGKGLEDMKKTSEKTKGEWALFMIRYLVSFSIYGGFTVVVIGLCVMRPPEQLWGPGGGPPVNPAMVCVMILTSLYFLVYLILMILRMVTFQQRFDPMRDVVDRVSQREVEVCPQLCVLFVIARLRTLQLDPVNGNPPRYVQICFYLCTYGVLALTVLGLISGNMSEKRELNKQQSEETKLGTIQKCVEALRWLVTIIFHGACFFAVLGVINLDSSIVPASEGPAPAMPPSMKCTLWLTILYFMVFLLREICDSRKKLYDLMDKGGLEGNPSKEKRLRDWLDNDETGVRSVVGFCPILSVLFMGAFLRALEITNNEGAPPPWAQLCMYIIAFGCIPLKILARLDSLMQVGDGNTKIIFSVVQHLCLFLMYTSSILVIISIFVMTPETAKGSGSWNKAQSAPI